MIRRAALAVVASTAVYASSGRSQTQWTPDETSQLREPAVLLPERTSLFKRNVPAQVAADVSKLIQELRQIFRPETPRILEVGRLDGDTPDVFGHISKVIPVLGGDFFVLDRQMFEIRWFDSRGRPRGQAGGQGAGPGEFRSPAAMFFDSGQNVIHAWDRRNSRFSLFRPEPGGLRHLRDIRVDSSVDEFCIMNGEYYLLNAYDSLTIRRITADGKMIGSFAPRLEVSKLLDPKLPQQLRVSFRAGYNRAALYCDPRRQIIVLSHTQLPVVRAFTAQGDQLWSAELDDFHQLRWQPVPRSTAYQQSADPKTKTVTFVSSVFLAAPGVLALTLADGGLLRGERTTREVRLLSLRDGKEVGRLATPDYSVVSIRGSRLYASTNRPYPRVLVFRYDNGGGAR